MRASAVRAEANISDQHDRVAAESAFRRKAREWLFRYAPAEAFAAVWVVLIATLVFRWSHNRLWAAVAGTGAELTAFYTVMWIRDRHYPRRRRAAKLIVEFLPPGLVNSSIVRPYLLYTLPLYVGNFGMGILIGKLLADLCFYLMTIPMYEISKRLAALQRE